MFSQGKFLSRLRVLENVLQRSESTAAGKQSYSLQFFDKEVQQLLKKMTNINLEQVFKRRPMSAELKPPVYKLMTTKQLQQEFERIQKLSEKFLQIPPLITPKEYGPEILHEDFSIDGFDADHSKFVFTDISSNLLNEEREVVVREPNGVLRTASRCERHRMNQIYFPLEGRDLEIPKLFEDEYLKGVLDREDYLYILDKACAQFDPDDPMYHKVIQTAYEVINDRGHFERLHSTRHFGSLAFYLVSHKKIDDLLIDNIKSQRIEDAHSLVRLYHIIHPNCESAKSTKNKNRMEILKNFISLDANKKNALELMLQDYINKEQERKEREASIQKAHGL